MSIILKGIDLPKEVNGTKLTLELYVRSDGKVLDDDLEEIAEAIQIPKGHGRLIDADKLRKGFSRTESGYCGYWEFCDKPEDMQFLIDDEPTILEAEEEDERQ